jgi:hypothetical protein
LPGFEFPDAQALPEDIRDLMRRDAIEYSHRWFSAIIDRIQGPAEEAGVMKRVFRGGRACPPEDSRT